MNVFIGASARNGIAEKYLKEADKIADYLVKEKANLIFCADERGIIGRIYNKVKTEKSGKIILTLPKIYEKYAKNINEKIEVLTDTINERTDDCIKRADICLFMPGGIGTIYEMFSTIETKRAGEHNSPIIILNVDGYYDNMFNMINLAQKEKFLNKEDKDVYKIAKNGEEVIKIMEEYK